MDQVVVLAVLALMSASCGTEEGSEQARAALGGSPSAAERRPSATFFLRNASEASLTVMQLRRGETETVRVAEVAPGDSPFVSVERDGKFVFCGIGGTCALDLS